MAVKKVIYVRVSGTSINQYFKVLSHEVLGLPAGTYHVFEMENGAKVFLNDFGVRTVTVADDPDKLN
jgi:hypothetical protein